MTDLKTAQALQRSILGPGRLALPCGCILLIDGYFPKKPWVHVYRFQHICSPNCPNADGENSVSRWVNKHTFKRVLLDEFDEAWSKAKKIVSRAGTLGVKISLYAMATSYVQFDTINRATFDPREEAVKWPPKMIEVFKTSR